MIAGGPLTVAAAAAGLGVIGMDPAGALLAAAALAVGSRTRDVVVFGLVVLLGTAVVGLVLSLTVGEQLLELDWAALLPRGGFRAALEAGGAVGLLGWWAIRRRPGRRAGGRPRPAGSGSASPDPSPRGCCSSPPRSPIRPSSRWSSSPRAAARCSRRGWATRSGRSSASCRCWG